MSPVRRLVLLAPLLGLVAVALATSPASAHTGFDSSQPADGERSDLPVAEIVLTFTGPADPAGEGFVVLDPSGVVRAPDRVEVDAERHVWTLAFEPPLAGGAVGVRWTVQAPDAHPINGAFSFIAADPVAVTTTTTTAPDTETSDLTTASAPSTAPAQDESASAAVDPAENEPTAAIDLDAFLAQREASLPYADGVGAAGRLIGFVGTMLTIGGLAFATTVVRDHRRDMWSVLKAVGLSALAIVAGTAVDVVAHVAVANEGWSGVLDLGGFEAVANSAFGVAVGLRAAAGVLLFVAVRAVRRPLAPMLSVSEGQELVAIGAEAMSDPASSFVEEHGFVADGPPTGRPLPDQLPSTPGKTAGFWWPVTPLTVGLVIALLASFTFDGHTVTEGNRWVTGAVDMIHVVAASIWAGGVVAFAVVLWRRHHRAERLNGLELALRFSTIAGAGLALAGIAGTVLATIILDEVSQLWTTPWGRLLVAKTLAVATAAAVGTYNHFVVIPWMNQHPDDDSRSVRIRNTATAEAIFLAVVIGLTAVLVAASSQG